MQPIRTVFAGASHPHGEAYLATLRGLDDFALAAVCEADDDLRAVLERSRPDCALIFAPNDRAPQLALQALEAGAHVYIEKPAGTSAAAVQAVAEGAHARGLVAAVGYQWRYNPAANEVRRLVGAGLLGELWSVEARMITSRVAARNPSHYLFDRAVSGGGILNWLGCHWIDLIRYLTGDEYERVTALAGNPSRLPIGVEEVASVAFTLAQGAVGSLHAGYVLPAGYDTFIGLRGSLGSIAWRPQNHNLRVHSQHPEWRGQPTREIRFEPEVVKGYGADGAAALVDFAAAVRDPARRPIRSDIQNGVSVLRLLDAAYAAAGAAQTGG